MSEDLVIKYSNDKNVPRGILDLMSEQCIYLYGNSLRAHEALRRMSTYNIPINGVIEAVANPHLRWGNRQSRGVA